ncbi:MAG: glycosyltransferase [Deltaproteobacteria bacterium]|nr:glycosyltransferase [Deltaproteobacteria bacterium]
MSFIVPVRNASDTLPDALASLYKQTFTDFDILVFNDGSTDGTAAALAEATDRDRRVRVVGSERVGLVPALRRLIDRSDSELIARMDADDVCHPERLAEQVALLDTRPGIQLASALIHCFPDELVRGGMRRYETWLNSLVEPEEIARDIFVESPICHPSVTMRREAYEATGGYVDDGNPEDYGLWLRFFERGFEMAKVPRVLLEWRESAKRLTRIDERYEPRRFIALKIKHLFLGPLRDRHAISIWGAGQTGRMWGRVLKEAGIEVAAFVDIDPNKIGGTVQNAPVLSPDDLREGIPEGFLLAAVGAAGARDLIRAFLADLDLRDPRDFLFVA